MTIEDALAFFIEALLDAKLDEDALKQVLQPMKRNLSVPFPSSSVDLHIEVEIVLYGRLWKTFA